MADFVTQGFDLGDAVQAQEFAPFSGRMITQLLQTRHPAQCQIGQQKKNRFHGVEAPGSVEVVLRVTQEAQMEQGAECKKHSAVRDIIGALKAGLGVIQCPHGTGHAFHRTSGAYSHQSLAIGHAALSQGACPRSRSPAFSRYAIQADDAFFLSRPARMALWIVLANTPNSTPMAGTLIPASSRS